ncbi:MAG: type II toxin-antitoxin system HicA family toxin [Nitrospirae bacterium]|nr:type II toxin-antitoxin system HicA family toxin [Nitrospirota bacterium]
MIPCSGADAVAKFKKADWLVKRQKGSHVMLTKRGYMWTLSIPQHEVLGRGLLRKLIHQAGITVEEFNGIRGNGTGRIVMGLQWIIYRDYFKDLKERSIL